METKPLNSTHTGRALEAYVYSLFKAEGHTEIWGEPKNEYGYEEGEAYSFADMENWYRLRCEHLHKLGFKVVGSINGFITAGMIAPYIDLYDQHGIITTAEADAKMTENGQPYSKVIWNTDGAWSGNGSGYSALRHSTT